MNGHHHEEKDKPLTVVIVGCGLGGLACAIQCRKEGLEVLMLEKTPELSEVGAGIQIPPNAGRILRAFGLKDKLREAGIIEKQKDYYLRWQDGKVIGIRPGKDWAMENFGLPVCVIHRADYMRVLADEAKRLGVKIRLNCDVVDVDCRHVVPIVALASGEKISADVVVGADGLRSSIRTGVLGYVKEPEQTNDLAYRVVLSRADLETESNPLIRAMLDKGEHAMWLGNDMHVVMYTIRGGKEINMVLLTPDDLPPGVSKQPGDLAEMHKLFEDWDPTLKIFLSKVNKALKWKIWGMADLDTWVKGSVALIGDACHPGVPYLAQGAAQAVEDAAVLGRLLGLFSRSDHPKSRLPELLQLYQDIRKQRAMPIVRAADNMRDMFHALDGPAQEERDRILLEHDWWSENSSAPWALVDLKRLRGILGFDALKSADDGYTASRLGRK